MPFADVDTPALLLDLDVVEQNIATMAAFFAKQSANLRPHFKSPKCPEIARRQLEAGAIGITCAKIGEAEEIANAGLEASVLIANQVIGARKLERLVALAQRLPELIVAIDSHDQIKALDSTIAPSGARIGALVEVDTGMKRCGTDTQEETVSLARAIEASHIAYRGVMGYEGHAVLIPDEAKRKELAARAVSTLQQHRQALIDAGLSPEIVSAGGTGTHDLTGVAEGVTEIQAGSYVFMDAAYGKVRSEFAPALTVLMTILRRRDSVLITDCGSKALTREFGLPRGADLPLAYTGLSEEHGHLLIDEGAELDLAPGDRIRVIPSHSDTTLNLHDEYQVVRGDTIEAVWPISARGKFK